MAGTGFSVKTMEWFRKTNQAISTLGLEAETAGDKTENETTFSAGKKRKDGTKDKNRVTCNCIMGWLFTNSSQKIRLQAQLGLKGPVTYFPSLKCSVALLMWHAVRFVACCACYVAVVIGHCSKWCGGLLCTSVGHYCRWCGVLLPTCICQVSQSYDTCQNIWGRSHSLSQIGNLTVTCVFEPQWDNIYYIKLPYLLEYAITPHPLTVFSLHKHTCTGLA
jgi:hypothetical protein